MLAVAMTPSRSKLTWLFWKVAEPPGLRRWLWRNVYQLLARIDDPGLACMNYGFAADNGDPDTADGGNETGKYGLRLYSHLLSQVDIAHKRILEVGCGHGGGCVYMRRLGRAWVVGADIAERAVARCVASYDSPGLSFVCGDAEALGFRSGCFDILVNIESSHCYGSFKRFLSEANRVLDSGGYCLCADFRDVHGLADLENDVKESSFSLIGKSDITANVVAALERDSSRRAQLVQQYAPRLLRKPLRQFAGLAGSSMYCGLRDGHVKYFSLVLRKERP